MRAEVMGLPNTAQGLTKNVIQHSATSGIQRLSHEGP
jgi:hypothetical protein